MKELENILIVLAQSVRELDSPQDKLEALNELDATKRLIAQDIFDQHPEASYDLFVQLGICKPRDEYN